MRFTAIKINCQQRIFFTGFFTCGMISRSGNKQLKYWLERLFTSEQYGAEIPVLCRGDNWKPSAQGEEEAAGKGSCRFCRKRPFVKTRGTWGSRNKPRINSFTHSVVPAQFASPSLVFSSCFSYRFWHAFSAHTATALTEALANGLLAPLSCSPLPISQLPLLHLATQLADPSSVFFYIVSSCHIWCSRYFPFTPPESGILEHFCGLMGWFPKQISKPLFCSNRNLIQVPSRFSCTKLEISHGNWQMLGSWEEETSAVWNHHGGKKTGIHDLIIKSHLLLFHRSHVWCSLFSSVSPNLPHLCESPELPSNEMYSKSNFKAICIPFFPYFGKSKMKSGHVRHLEVMES